MSYIENQIFDDIQLEYETIKDKRFIDCTFKNCKFESIQLINVTALNCIFNNCTIINPDSDYSEINNATFDGCNLIGVSWGLFAGVNKHRRILNEIQHSFLKYNTFIDLTLNKQDFSTNTFQGSSFESCDLKQSSFKGCSLSETTFVHCDLKKSDFRESRGYIMDLETNLFKDAKFSFPEVLTLLDQTGMIVE